MRSLTATLQSHAVVLLSLLGLMWGSEIVDQVILNEALDGLGIRPRVIDSLPGIALSPFLHGGFPHLIANTLPFVVLGWFVMLRAVRDFAIVTVVVAVLGGLGVWLFGRGGTVHIGASLLIFGYLGFLILRGYFQRSFGSVLIAVVVGALYGSALVGVLPGQRGVSWEGHLFGFLGGVACARFLPGQRRPGRAT
jgi:membrane associated rhomboid family serine protease